MMFEVQKLVPSWAIPVEFVLAVVNGVPLRLYGSSYVESVQHPS